MRLRYNCQADKAIWADHVQVRSDLLDYKNSAKDRGPLNVSLGYISLLCHQERSGQTLYPAFLYTGQMTITVNKYYILITVCD